MNRDINIDTAADMQENQINIQLSHLGNSIEPIVDFQESTTLRNKNEHFGRKSLAMNSSSINTAMETSNQNSSKSNRIPLTGIYSDEDNEIALTSKGLNYKGINDEPYLRLMQLDESTMDVSLVVNNQKLNAHKAVLASKSDYFDRMFDSYFKERFEDKIEINITDVSFEILSTLDLLISSNIFLLDEIQNVCVNYIKKIIDTENCIKMKDFANTLGLNDLYSLCMSYIVKNFRLLKILSPSFNYSQARIELVSYRENLVGPLLFLDKSSLVLLDSHILKYRSKYTPTIKFNQISIYERGDRNLKYWLAKSLNLALTINIV
ncbi:hypothetical protein AGLY_013735 [Aphis glycines]|uniref:BTB domain-containing protein n=1 Tax=Aphis glycines TaxID=307491 RepID=A0A6G0T7B7_APHGL|nr:hypothetical protein AGLY_013735 [Aphis glycines]